MIRMRNKKILNILLTLSLIITSINIPIMHTLAKEDPSKKPIILRVSNWEEYIDLGEWDEGSEITLDNGAVIYGERPLYEDFEDWYYECYGRKVKVEYSTSGTNEELYNLLTMGDVYDLICPSEYMIMKLMTEGWLQPYSESFYDTSIEENYYARGVSPYIKKTMDSNEINGESWGKYAACYMWGVTGMLYNSDVITESEAGTWKAYDNPKLYKQLTLKDNVRDTYFTALGIMKADKFMDPDFKNSEDYHYRLSSEMNDTSPETISEAEDMLSDLVPRVYSMETDSGKTDLLSGKIAANYQWSGDAAYIINEAGEDSGLKFAVPKECTNLWFDGWVMLEKGINGDSEKQHAAEAFVNFMSRPDNAVRNMEYIGYTSSISGGDDDTVYEYIKYRFEPEDMDARTMQYPLGYFFSGNADDSNYIVNTDTRYADGGELYARYPTQDVMNRSVVMQYFDTDANHAINQMWIHIRCKDIRDISIWTWFIAGGIALMLIAAFIVTRGIWKINRKK